MRTLCLLTALAAFASPLFLPQCSENIARAKDWPIRIKHRGLLSDRDATKSELCVLDGEVMFVSFRENSQRPGGPDDPPLPDFSLQFLWRGPIVVPRAGDSGMLRAKIKQIGVRDKGNVSAKLLAKDGWYVTADFSTDPPQVVLTEKPTKGSSWASVNADYPACYLFKNVDAPGEAVWLTMAKEGKTYRGGIARKPILSTEKSRFFIDDANSGK
jgi:hypothetical protein